MSAFFSIAGHTRSWSLSHPEIFAKCYELGEETPFYGGLDPSKNETLELLAALFEEVVALFPDATLHMGFDEVEFSCWFVVFLHESLLVGHQIRL